jgi:hypothetical protein
LRSEKNEKFVFFFRTRVLFAELGIFDRHAPKYFRIWRTEKQKKSINCRTRFCFGLRGDVAPKILPGPAFFTWMNQNITVCGGSKGPKKLLFAGHGIV